MNRIALGLGGTALAAAFAAAPSSSGAATAPGAGRIEGEEARSPRRSRLVRACGAQAPAAIARRARRTLFSTPSYWSPLPSYSMER